MAVLRTNNRPRRLSGGGGFSLVELIAVMVVIGILAGTAIVSMSSTTGNRPAMAAKQLLRDLTFARQRSVATGTRSWVDFDTVSHTWTVLAEPPDTTPARSNAAILTDPATHAPFVQELDTGPFIAVQLTSVDFDTEDWIGFDWLGRPLKKTAETTPLTANGTVQLTGGHTVTVNKDTGHITYAGP